MDLFAYRALAAVVTAYDRLEGERENGVSGVVGWNNCSVDLIHAARTHGHYIILRCFVQEVEKVEDANIKRVLTAVCGLYATTHMQEHLGDWVGHLGAKQANALKGAVRHLLKEVRRDAVGLTDAFEFSDNVLNSALGRRDGKVYESLYAAAKNSSLNNKDPFDGYEWLSKRLDKEFIAEHAKMVRSAPIVHSKL